MSVVSNISDSRPYRSSDVSTLPADRRNGRATPWIYLVLLWAVALLVLAVGASAVVGIAS
jgi:hypothetical protein